MLILQYKSSESGTGVTDLNVDIKRKNALKIHSTFYFYISTNLKFVKDMLEILLSEIYLESVKESKCIEKITT